MSVAQSYEETFALQALLYLEFLNFELHAIVLLLIDDMGCQAAGSSRPIGESCVAGKGAYLGHAAGPRALKGARGHRAGCIALLALPLLP